MQHGKVVLDTNCIMNNEDIFNEYESVILPIVVIEEIDHLKGSSDAERAYKARKASRAIEKANNVEIVADCEYNFPEWLDSTRNDNKIIGFAKQLYDSDNSIKLVSGDLNVIHKCKAKGIDVPCEKFNGNIDNELYTGIKYIELKDDDSSIPDILNSINVNELTENQYVLIGIYETNIKYNQKQFQTVKSFRWSNGLFEDVPTPRLGEKLNDCFRDNAEQSLIYDAMNCDFIDIIVITGCAGTGKNWTALANALFQVNKPSKNKRGNYKSKSIVYTRNMTEVANEKVGFLPGELGNKISPFMSPSRINLQKLLDLMFGEGQEDIDKLMDEKKYQEVPISFLRGTTLDDSFMIYDECANASKDDLKTFISRAGNSSKVILIGSFNQIDKKGNTATNNGLYEVIKRYQGQKNFACINLINQERSFVAQQADELLK